MYSPQEKKTALTKEWTGWIIYSVYIFQRTLLSIVSTEKNTHTHGKWEGDHRRCFSCYKNFLWKKYREKMITDFICTEKGGVCFWCCKKKSGKKNIRRLSVLGRLKRYAACEWEYNTQSCVYLSPLIFLW